MQFCQVIRAVIVSISDKSESLGSKSTVSLSNWSDYGSWLRAGN